MIPRRTSGHDDQHHLIPVLYEQIMMSDYCKAVLPKRIVATRPATFASARSVLMSVGPSRRPSRCGAAREAPSRAAASRYDPRQGATFLRDAERRQPAAPVLIASVPSAAPQIDLRPMATAIYPTSQISFVRWLTIQLRLRSSLSGASFPKANARSVSSVSPSLTLARPVRLAAIAARVGTRSNHAAATQCRFAKSVRNKAK